MRMNISLNDHHNGEEMTSDENLLQIDLTIDSPNPKIKTESDTETNAIPVTNRPKKRGRQKKIYECEVCHKQLVGVIMYNFHLKNKHRKSVSVGRGAAKRTYRCFVCNKEIRGYTQYTAHLKIVHRQNNMNASWDGTLLKCPVCKITLRGCNLCPHLSHVHDTTLDKLGPFSCSTCDRVFARFGNLLHHESTVHKSVVHESDEIQDIPETDEKFGQNTHLSCSNCSKSFALECWLIKHEEKCLDNSTFKERWKNLKVNLFKCSVCPSVFTRKHNRAAHESKYHSNRIVRKPRIKKRIQKKKISEGKCTPRGVKIIYAHNLHCSYCPKLLAHVGSKQLHEKLHTGDRPHQCTGCGASFRLEQTFLDHRKKCSDLVDVLWCDGCDYNCKLRSQLVSHYNSQHQCDLDVYEARRGRGPVENGVPNFEMKNEQIPEESDVSEEKFPIDDEETVLSEVRVEEDDQWSLVILDDDDED